MVFLSGLGIVGFPHLRASESSRGFFSWAPLEALQESTDRITSSDPEGAIDLRILRGWDSFQDRCKKNDSLAFLKKRVAKVKEKIDDTARKCEPFINQLVRAYSREEDRAALYRELSLRTEYGRNYVNSGYQREKKQRTETSNAYKKLRGYFSDLETLERQFQRENERLFLVEWRADHLSWPTLEANFKADGEPLQEGWDLATLADSGWIEGEVSLGDGAKGLLVRCSLYRDSLEGFEPKVVPKKLLLVLGTSRVPLSREVGPAGIVKGTVASLKGFQEVSYKGETVQVMACYLGSLTKALTAKRRSTESKELRGVPDRYQSEDLIWASGRAFDPEPPKPDSE